MDSSQEEGFRALGEGFIALQKWYVDSWPEKRERFAALLKDLREGRDACATLEEIQMEFHRLAGTGGTYGFPRVTAAARAGENFAAAFKKPEAQIPPQTADRLEEFVTLLDDSFAGREESEPS